MRRVGVREAQAQLSGLVSKSQKERIILTRHGKPVAVLKKVENALAIIWKMGFVAGA